MKRERVSLSSVIQVGDRICNVFSVPRMIDVYDSMKGRLLFSRSKDDKVVLDLDKAIGVFGMSRLPHSHKIVRDSGAIVGLASNGRGEKRDCEADRRESHL
jgi:hypothetical protein